jgi:hypothetical protein
MIFDSQLNGLDYCLWARQYFRKHFVKSFLSSRRLLSIRKSRVISIVRCKELNKSVKEFQAIALLIEIRETKIRKI